MGFMSRLEARSSALHPGDPELVRLLGGGMRSATGRLITPEIAMRNSVVWRCVTLDAKTYASLPLSVYRIDANGDKTIDKSHRLHRLLHNQPNKWQTSFEWREMMAGHFALRNRCYSEIYSDGGTGIAQLIPLHPDRVRPFWAPDGRIAFAYTPRVGGMRVILQDEMHWMHGTVLADDGITPLGPIASNSEVIALAMASEEHAARLYGNGTHLGGLLKMEGHLENDEARKELLKSWKAAHSGLGNAGKTALLEDGLDYKQLGMTAVESQMVEVLGLNNRQIAMIWGTPLHLVGDLDRMTNNNIEVQDAGYVTHSIRPGAVRWEQAMSRDLFYGSDRDTHEAKFNLDALMRGDSLTRARVYAIGRQWGWESANSVLRREDRPPLAKGGDVYMTPVNMQDAAQQKKDLLDDTKD